MFIKLKDRAHFAHVQLALLARGYTWASGDTDLLYLEETRLPQSVSAHDGLMYVNWTGCSTVLKEHTVARVSCYTKGSYILNYSISLVNGWRIGTANAGNLIVARDKGSNDAIVTLVRHGERVPARTQLELKGYDTSGHEWDECGRIIFK